MKKKKKDTHWSDIDGGMAFVVPLTLLRHENFHRLSPWAAKLLFDLGRQYTGYNNGYLCASRSLMTRFGWRSTHTLQKAVAELEHYQIILRTRQGGRNRSTLHALTWRRIDEKPGNPLDERPTTRSPDLWKDVRPLFVRTLGERKTKRRAALRLVQ